MTKVLINGRLTKEPEMYERDGGRTYASFSVASKNSRGNTDFYRCYANRESDIRFLNEYTHKGDIICVVGELVAYDNKDGVKLFSVNVDSLESLKNRG